MLPSMPRDPRRAAMNTARDSSDADARACAAPHAPAAAAAPAHRHAASDEAYYYRQLAPAPPVDPSIRRSAGETSVQRSASWRADDYAGAPAEAGWLQAPPAAFPAAAAAMRTAQRSGGGSCDPSAAAVPAMTTNLRSLLARLSTTSGVQPPLLLEDLSFIRFKPAVWHAVLSEAVARSARCGVTWRTPAEALRALKEACCTHVASQALGQEQQHPNRPGRDLPSPATTARHRSPSTRWHRAAERGAEPQSAERWCGISKDDATPATLHVRFLPVQADAQEVAEYFRRFGQLRFVVCPRPTAQRCAWRYASVTFAERSSALAALKGAAHQRLRPDGQSMSAVLSEGALLPKSNSDDQWTAPELLIFAQAAAGGGVGRPRNRARSRSRTRSRSRSLERFRHSYGHRRETTPPPPWLDRGQSAMPASLPPDALHAKPQAARPKPRPQAAPAPPPPPLLPPAVSLPTAMAATSSAAPMVTMPQVQYRSLVTCALFSRGAAVAAAPIAVVGTPLSGDPALPRPLALELHWPASQVESLGAHLPPSRHSVVSMDGEDAASATALRALVAQLAAPTAQPGGEAWAAGVFSSDGAAHFFLPPSAAALRIIVAARPGVQPPSLTAAAIAVSFLLTDASVAAAEKTRAVILAALQASRATAQAQQLHA